MMPTPDETLLGLLANAPMHGYALMEHFDHPDHLGRVWHLSTSQLYAVLKRLEKQAYIVGRAVQMADAPTRIEYAITSAGRTALLTWLNEPAPSPSIRRVRVDFCSRLYIAARLGQDIAPLIARQRAACEEARARLHAERADAASMGRVALELAIAQLDAAIAWMDRLQTGLQLDMDAVQEFTS